MSREVRSIVAVAAVRDRRAARRRARGAQQPIWSLRRRAATCWSPSAAPAAAATASTSRRRRLGRRRAARADTTYAETDTYSLELHASSCRPAAARATRRSRCAGSGQLSGTEQLGPLRRHGRGDEHLHAVAAPAAAQANAADLAYPGVNVVASGRLVTVGALGELRAQPRQPSCTGAGSAEPNLVQGYAGLQASVSFPRALLAAHRRLQRRRSRWPAPASTPASR